MYKIDHKVIIAWKQCDNRLRKILNQLRHKKNSWQINNIENLSVVFVWPHNQKKEKKSSEIISSYMKGKINETSSARSTLDRHLYHWANGTLWWAGLNLLIKAQNADKFSADLQSVPWHISETDDKWYVRQSLFTSVLNEHFPICRKHVRKSTYTWLDKSILFMMRRRDKYHKKAKEFNRSSDWRKYRRPRNSCLMHQYLLDNSSHRVLCTFIWIL